MTPMVKCIHGCNSRINIMINTNQQLHKRKHMPIISNTIEVPRSEPTILLLLSEHIIKLPPRFTSLDLRIFVALRPHQRSSIFVEQWLMQEPQSDHSEKISVLEYWILDETCLSLPPTHTHTRLRDQHRTGDGNIVSCWGTCPLDMAGPLHSWITATVVVACTRLAQGQFS